MLKRVLAGGAVVLLAVGGYGVLDVHDKVPGILTLDSTSPSPVPLPSQTTPAPAYPAPKPPSAPSAVPVASGQPLSAPQVAAALKGPLASKGYLTDTSVVVRDAATGATLFDQGGARALIPASTTKLLAAWAVATTMDLNKPFTTKVVDHGGQPVLVAGGDTVLAPGKGDPNQIVGHAGVADLAAQVATGLKKRGRTSVTVGLDTTTYAPGPDAVRTWHPDYLGMGFSARIAQLGLSTERSQPPKPAAADPNRSVLNALVSELGKRGITAVAGGEVKSAAGVPVLGSVQSAPLIDVLGQAMRDSDNAMIESLTRAAAFSKGVPSDTVTTWVSSLLEKDGFDTTGVKLADVSGLSDGTTIPAKLLSDLLVAGTTGRSKPFQEVLARESVAAWNGTLHDRYCLDSDKWAAGEVRAKTGSLPDVSSLAGTVVTDSGRLLVFAIISNGPMNGAGAWGVRAAIDNTVAALAKL